MSVTECDRCSALTRTGARCKQRTCKYAMMCWQHTKQLLYTSGCEIRQYLRRVRVSSPTSIFPLSESSAPIAAKTYHVPPTVPIEANTAFKYLAGAS